MIGNHLTESNVNELAALSGLAYPVGLAPSIHKVLVTQAQNHLKHQQQRSL